MNEKTRKLVTVGVLIAVEVAAGRLVSISLPAVKSGCAFLPLAVIAMLYGPVWSGAAAGISDILIALLGSFGYFPLLTIPAILTGIIYGFSFYRKPISLPRVTLTVLCDSVFVSLLLKTYFLTFQSGLDYLALLPGRAIQNLITCPLQIICIRFIARRIALLAGGSAYRSGEHK